MPRGISSTPTFVKTLPSVNVVGTDRERDECFFDIDAPILRKLPLFRNSQCPFSPVALPVGYVLNISGSGTKRTSR
jgi:hypothetical protein